MILLTMDNTTANNGQHHCNSLHQQTGRDSLPRTESPDQGPMAMVPVQEYCSSSNTFGRCSECYSRRRIKGNEGQNRLEALPRHLCPNQLTVWTTTSGPICVQTDTPTPPICELASRSRCNGMQCFCPGLVTVQRGICKSPMEHDRQSPVSSLQTACPVGPDCPSVEVTTLVPTTSGNGSEDTNPSTQQKEPNPTNTQCQPSGHKSTTSHVGYLREKCRDQKLSEEASRLLLSSWRPKSSKTYDSLFTKWASYIGQQSLLYMRR